MQKATSSSSLSDIALIVASCEWESSLGFMMPGSEQLASSIMTNVHTPRAIEPYERLRQSCGSAFVRNATASEMSSAVQATINVATIVGNSKP